MENYAFNPQNMLITPGIVDEIRTFDSVAESALCIVRLLNGKETKTREDIVALNAGLILYIRDKVTSIREGDEMGLELIHKGKAWEKLKTWVNCQKRDGLAGLKILADLEEKVTTQDDSLSA